MSPRTLIPRHPNEGTANPRPATGPLVTVRQ